MTTQISENTKEPREKSGVEPFLTLQQTAKELGIHTWALRRAINAGTIPAYQPFNSRRLVRLSEVVAAINASKIGGDNV